MRRLHKPLMIGTLTPVCRAQKAQEQRERAARKAREAVENQAKVGQPPPCTDVSDRVALQVTVLSKSSENRWQQSFHFKRSELLS